MPLLRLPFAISPNLPFSPVQRTFFRSVGLLVLLLGVRFAAPVAAQTDFAPGEIMFTGYNSDDPDAFSIVLLTDVVSGTAIYITDRGWSNTTGFRVDNNGEGTISLTFNQNYPCGTSIVFTDINTGSIWEARDINQNLIGTVAIESSGDPQGIEFNVGGFPFPDGDQLFIYQLPEPTAGNQTTFITGIHMNGGAWNGGNGDDYQSQKPDGLGHDQVVRFNTEYDNAKYNCSVNYEQADNLRAAITNVTTGTGLIPDGENRWQESNNTYLNLFPACDFCCAAVPLPVLSFPGQVAPNQVFTVTITGTLPPGEEWELRLGSCNTGMPLTTTGNTFTLTAPATEQTLNYYLQNSGETSCPDDCIPFNICVESDPLAPCTDCNANPLACGNCFLPPPDDNPDLDSGCFEVRILLILDESGSIGTSDDSVRAGVLAFLNALNGQNVLCGLIEFSSTATVVNNYVIIDNGYIQNITNYFDATPGYNGFTYVPNGGTNWHDAMLKADPLVNPDLILFFTDGIPTVWNTNGNACGDGSTTQTPEIVNPVKLANKFKGEGTHMFMLGVGTGIDEENLQTMSGYTEYISGTNTIGTADYSIGSFGELAEDLENFVDELCQTPLVLTKELAGPSCDSTVQFRFVIYNPGTQSAATVVNLIDTLPPGFANPVRIFPTNPFTKFCVGGGCEGFGPPPAGPQPPNTFIWVTNSLPPGERDTLIVEVDILPSGATTNIAWAQGFNTNLASDTVVNPAIADDLSPILFCPPNVAIQCDESTLPANTGDATASDNSSFPIDIVYADVTSGGTCPGEYSIERTWTATDVCNNSVECVQTIDVVDTESPVLDCPANVTLTCGEDTSTTANGVATAEDVCAGEIVPTFTDVPVPGPCIEELVIQRIWTATDLCGNTGTCVQLLTIIDNVDPVMICPADVTIGCTDSTLPASTGSASGSDNCTAEVIVSYDDDIVPGACSQAYTITRSWAVADECGNIVTCEQVIEVVDDLAPIIAAPADVTIECTASTAPAATGQATGSDICDPSPAITHADVIVAGDCPQAYTIERTWTVEDDCGHSATGLQVITVRDSTTPDLDCPADVTIACDASTLPANTGEATASDGCTPDLEITYTDILIPSGDPGPNPLPAPAMRWVFLGEGETNGTCASGTDCADDVLCFGLEYTPGVTGNISSYTTGFIVGCINGSVPVLSNVSCSMPDASAETTCVGDVFLMNCSGNSGNVSITANVPVILHQVCLTLPAGASISLEEETVTNLSVSIDLPGGGAETELPAYTTYLVDRDVLCNPAPACPQNYTIIRTFSVEDDCGNTATCSQTIVVADVMAPAMTCPANLTIECTASTEPDSTGFATATDNCDASPDVAFSDATVAGTCPNEWTITRTWTSTDTCGNSSTCVQVLTIIDSTPPAITCPADLTITCLEDTAPDSTGVATATDNCDSAPGVAYADSILNPPGDPGYVIERTWTATDTCGNATTCLQVITVTNPLDPEELPYDTICSGESIILEAIDPGYPGMMFDWSFGSGASPGSAGTAGPHTVTYAYNGSNGTTGAWVLLTLEADGCEAVTDTVTNVHVNVVPAAGITTPSGSPCVFAAKTFEPNTPEVPGYAYLWDFGAGAVPATASTYGPHTVEYSTAGSKTVQLIIQSNEPGASCSDTATTTFTVNACNGGIFGSVKQVNGTGIVGNTVRLFADNNLDGVPEGAPIRTVNTVAPNGTYAMGGVTPGYYVIVQTQPTGFFSVLDEDPSEDFDSLANLNPNDNIIPVTIEPSEVDADNNFIEAQSPGLISGYVFNDVDNDQAPDTGEGIAGVAVQLFADTNQDGEPDNGTPLASTTTSGIGYYTFGNLTTGDYVLVETQPGGFNNVKDIDVSNDGDAVANANMTDDKIPVTLTTAEQDAGNYFIEVSPCSRIVTTTADDGQGSLRYMVDCASSGDTITFHSSLAGDTLTLTSARIVVDKSLYIRSSLTPDVVIRSIVPGMFKVEAGHALGVENLIIISGLTGVQGAAFENLGDLTLYDVMIRPNALLVPLEKLIFNGPSAMLIFKGNAELKTD